jgi:hypothetical protein
MGLDLISRLAGPGDGPRKYGPQNRPTASDSATAFWRARSAAGGRVEAGRAGDAGGGRYDGPVIEFTQWAIDILRRSHEAARRVNPEATVRVFRSNGSVQFALTDQAEEGDRRIEQHGFVLLVEQGIEGTIDVVEPHDQLVLRKPDPGGAD